MKKLVLFLTLFSLVFSSSARAVEYVALSLRNTEVSIDPSDVFEIVGYSGVNGSITLWYPQGSTTGVTWGDGRSRIGYKFTGYSKVTHGSGDVTLKITKASEINKVGPTSVLVLPENATGNYDLIVESSSDSVTWTPFHSQAVQSDTVKRLFRVRIVHKGQEEAKAKAEEK